MKINHAISLFFYSQHQQMAIRHLTGVSQFLLLGVSEELKLQHFIFGLFLSMYLITVFGNLLIILAVSSDSHLHTPMYFFLSNLSFVDICFTSTTIPMLQKQVLEKPSTTLRESENSGLLSQQTQRS